MRESLFIAGLSGRLPLERLRPVHALLSCSATEADTVLEIWQHVAKLHALYELPMLSLEQFYAASRYDFESEMLSVIAGGSGSGSGSGSDEVRMAAEDAGDGRVADSAWQELGAAERERREDRQRLFVEVCYRLVALLIDNFEAGETGAITAP